MLGKAWQALAALPALAALAALPAGSIPQVLALIDQKLVPTSEAVAPQSQELLRCLKEEAKHLPRVLLGPLLPYHVKGLKPLSRILPSIHQLHPTNPRASSLILLSHTLGLPVGKVSAHDL